MDELNAESKNYAMMCASNIIGTLRLYGQKGLVKQIYARAKSFNPFTEGKLNCPNCWMVDEYEIALRVEAPAKECNVVGCVKCGFFGALLT
jgi:hypothetical protein